VVQRGHVVSRFRTRKTAGLLAYLSYYADRAHPRDVVVDLFWPTLDGDAGRNNLSTALSSLRSILPLCGTEPLVLADRHSIRINPAVVSTDVSEFDRLLKSVAEVRCRPEQIQRLTRALDIYKAALLPGYYDPWIVSEQERLAERYLNGLHRLVSCLCCEGSAAAALPWAMKAVKADPLREEARCDLMRVYEALGQPAAALKQYADLEQVLQDELSAAPGAEARQLARRLQAPSVVAMLAGVGEFPSGPGRPQNGDGAQDPAHPSYLPGRPRAFTGACGRESAEAASEEPMTLAYLSGVRDQHCDVLAKDAVVLQREMSPAVPVAACSSLERASLMRRHGEWVIAIAAANAGIGPDQPDTSGLLDAEQQNVRLMLAWCVDNDPGLGLRLVGAMLGHWESRGLGHEAMHWLQLIAGRLSARQQWKAGLPVDAIMDQRDLCDGYRMPG
jgi:DNA-binding SARP family transcriptional activator